MEGASMGPIGRVLLAIGAMDGAFRTYLQQTFGQGVQVVGSAEMVDQVPGMLAELQPDVLLLSRYLPGSVPVRDVLFACRQAGLRTKIVLLAGPEDDEGRELVSTAISAQIFHFQFDDARGVDTDALTRLLLADRTYADVARYHLGAAKLTVPAVVAQVAIPADEEQAARPDQRGRNVCMPDVGGLFTRKASEGPRPPLGKVLAVFGASGGVGRTTAVANLAAALASAGYRVSALDLSVHTPALADHLGLRSYAAERWQALLRGESPAVVLVPGGVEGVRVFPGPSPSEMSAVLAGAEPVRRLIHQLRLEDDFIVVDTPGSPFDPFAAAAFEEANVAVFVVSADMSSVKRLAAALTGPWSGGNAMKALIVNKARPEIGRDSEAVARELAARPNLVLADNPQLYWPSSAGSPVVLSNTPEGNAWRKLAALLAERAAAAPIEAAARTASEG